MHLWLVYHDTMPLSVTGGQTEAARSQKEVREIKDFEVFAFAVYNALE